MKILSAILATLILFLTGQPFLVGYNLPDRTTSQVVHNCCSGKQNSQSANNRKEKKKSNNCCSNGHCDNPFLGCANCYFINTDRSSFVDAIVLKGTKKTRVSSDKILSDYSQDFWHPPNSLQS